MKYNLSHITSLEILQREQQIVRKRIQEEENELRLKMYEIPGELAAAGAKSMIPKMFRGKITDAAINGGKRLINGFFAPSDQNKGNLLSYSSDKPGIFSILKNGFSLFKGKSK